MKQRRRRHASPGRLAVAMIAVMLGAIPQIVGGGTTFAQASPDDQGFASPGDVVSVEPSSFRLMPVLPTATRAWKILYHSTDALGHDDLVSGTLIVPNDGRTGARPLLAWAVGTVGMGDQCAPSSTMTNGMAAESASIARALRRGWAVVVTDYPGLGTPGDHTYMVGRAEGAAVLDAARAAQRLPEARDEGVTIDSPVGIMGYSQGGHASSWAAEMAREYAPELQVKGVVAGGVPSDLLRDVTDKMSLDGNGTLSLMVAIGHDAAYPELDLDPYLTPEGRALVQKMRGGCVLDNVLAAQGKSLGELLVRNPLDSPDWQKRFEDDRLGTRAPGYPVYLYHGTTDEIVPPTLGERLRSAWCALGNTVQWQSYPSAAHLPAAIAGSEPAMNWLGDRLDGRPAEGNC
ncbi:alpha/beta fold hydrolase [Nocardia sp. NPDC047654]|uniref:alpha/beta fold hydrolase n=1 Tax=Nocardia sp. NPDC047654 TaxID=3364314 RepID=UPI003724C397